MATKQKSESTESKPERFRRATHWQKGAKLQSFRGEGGTFVFVSRTTKAGGADVYPHVAGKGGQEFEENLAEAIGIPHSELAGYLKGRTVYASNVNVTMLSDDDDRAEATSPQS